MKLTTYLPLSSVDVAEIFWRLCRDPSFPLHANTVSFTAAFASRSASAILILQKHSRGKTLTYVRRYAENNTFSSHLPDRFCQALRNFSQDIWNTSRRV